MAASLAIICSSRDCRRSPKWASRWSLGQRPITFVTRSAPTSDAKGTHRPKLLEGVGMCVFQLLGKLIDYLGIRFFDLFDLLGA